MAKTPTRDTLGRLAAARPLTELTDALRTQGAATASGLWGSSVGAVTAVLQRALGRPVLVVCGHIDEGDDLADDIEFPDPQKSVRLLPEYDVYVMGFRERDEIVPERVREQVAADGRGRYEGPAGVRFLLVDGVAAGVWRRRKLAKRIEIDVAPIRRLRRAELEREVGRYAAFLGVEAVLRVE